MLLVIFLVWNCLSLVLTEGSVQCRGRSCFPGKRSFEPRRKRDFNLSKLKALLDLPATVKNSSKSYCNVNKYSSKLKNVTCYGINNSLDCRKPIPVGTLVSFKCPPFHSSTGKVSLCQENGEWSDPIMCTPECGIPHPPPAEPLIMHGEEMTQGVWPWAATLYKQQHKGSNWIFICGGTLVSDNAVVTAGHCIEKVEAQNLLVLLGHVKTLSGEELTHQAHEVERVYILPVYKGSQNRYNSDIAVMALKKRVKLTNNVLPACLPDLNITVTPYTSGIVAGWGKNERLKPQKVLHYIRVPIVDSVKCMDSVPKSFISHFSYSSFCAGFRNGSAPCQGDSGSGFLTEHEGKWFLQGVVSVSPRKGTFKACHPHSYTMYTKVKLYVEWILKVLQFEEKKAATDKERNSDIK